jgi:putative membrane protein
MNRRWMLAAVGFACLACHTERESSTSESSSAQRSSESKPAQPATAATGATWSSKSPPPEEVRALVDASAQANLYAVKGSELALERKITGILRDYAQMVVTDHTDANRKLDSIVREKGGVLPTALDAEHQRRLDELTTLDGVAFETKYRELQLQAHDESIALLERASRDRTDPELRAYWERMLAAARKHREHLLAQPPPARAPGD